MASCSWLGIGAGFLSGREGARRGERGQQQTGAHPCLSPSLFSLLLEKRGNCEPRVGRTGWGPQIGRGSPAGWAAFTLLFQSLGSLSQILISIPLPQTKPKPLSKSSNLQTNSRTLWNLHEASLPCPLPAVPAPQALLAHRFSVHGARDVGGGLGGARVGMKGPFSSTAGRTAAIKARLDTLCPEAPLQLACPPWTPLHFAFLSSYAWLPPGPWNSGRQGKFVTAATGV